MSDSFEQALDALRLLHERFPDWRLGQMVCNVSNWAREPNDGQVWDVEDDDISSVVTKYLAADSAGTTPNIDEIRTRRSSE